MGAKRPEFLVFLYFYISIFLLLDDVFLTVFICIIFFLYFIFLLLDDVFLTVFICIIFFSLFYISANRWRISNLSYIFLFVVVGECNQQYQCYAGSSNFFYQKSKWTVFTRLLFYTCIRLISCLLSYFLRINHISCISTIFLVYQPYSLYIHHISCISTIFLVY